MASLLERFGGEAGVSGFIDALYASMSVHPLLSKYMTGVNPETLKLYLKQWWVHALNPATPYSGRDLHTVHTGMHITDAELDLVKTLCVEIAQRSGMAEDLATYATELIEGQRRNITNL